MITFKIGNRTYKYEDLGTLTFKSVDSEHGLASGDVRFIFDNLFYAELVADKVFAHAVEVFWYPVDADGSFDPLDFKRKVLGAD